MEKEIAEQLKIEKVRAMKNPTILMNDKDFERFKEEVEVKVTNFKVGDKPTYEGIPIIARDYLEEGRLLIYDNSAPLVRDCKNCKFYDKTGCSNEKWACCIVRDKEGFVIGYNHHEFN